MSSSNRIRRRAVAAIVGTVATMTLVAACAAGPINIGTIPISGTSIMGVQVDACSPTTTELKVQVDFHRVDADYADVHIGRYSPSHGLVATTSWAKDGLHWEWTTEQVHAGDCLNFSISSGCRCCDPCEPSYQFGFDYRISPLP